MKIYFTNTGCSAEAEDFLRVVRLLHAEQTDDITEADIIIAHFCAISTESFEKIPLLMSVLHELKKRIPAIKIYAGGCASQVIDFEKRYHYIDGVFNRRYMVEDLSNYLGYDFESDENLPISYYNIIRIQSGCMRHCGFCKKSYLEMPLCSKPFDNVIRDIKSCGYHDIILHAENSTEYGYDLPQSVGLIDLLKAIDEIDEVQYVYLTGLCIDELISNSELTNYIKYCRKIRKVEVELHSLIPEVRDNMQLTSTVDDALRILYEFSNKYIITHLMLGYPGETDENFKNELELIKSNYMYYLQINTYDNTPMTMGHSFEQVPREVVAKRLAMINKTLKSVRSRVANIFIKSKSTFPCVCIGKKKFELLNHSAVVTVYNSYNVMVGQIVNVKITGMNKLFSRFDSDQTMRLIGEIV